MKLQIKNTISDKCKKIKKELDKILEDIQVTQELIIGIIEELAIL